MATSGVRDLKAQATKLFQQEKWVELVPQCLEVLAEEPRNAEICYYLARAHQALGSMETAQEAYEMAVAANPEMPEPHLFLGIIYRDNGDLEKAIFHFRELTRIAPEKEIGWKCLVQAMKANGADTETLTEVAKQKVLNERSLKGFVFRLLGPR